MYLIGIVIFSAFLVALATFSGGVIAFIDIPSLMVILGLSTPILMASGLMKDFLNGFRLMGSKVNPFSVIELKRMEQANRLAMTTLLLSGIMGTLIGTVGMITHVTDRALILPGLAVAILTTLYALEFIFLILPVQAKVKAVLSTME